MKIRIRSKKKCAYILIKFVFFLMALLLVGTSLKAEQTAIICAKSVIAGNNITISKSPQRFTGRINPEIEGNNQRNNETQMPFGHEKSAVFQITPYKMMDRTVFAFLFLLVAWGSAASTRKKLSYITDDPEQLDNNLIMGRRKDVQSLADVFKLNNPIAILGFMLVFLITDAIFISDFSNSLIYRFTSHSPNAMHILYFSMLSIFSGWILGKRFGTFFIFIIFISFAAWSFAREQLPAFINNQAVSITFLQFLFSGAVGYVLWILLFAAKGRHISCSALIWLVRAGLKIKDKSDVHKFINELKDQDTINARELALLLAKAYILEKKPFRAIKCLEETAANLETDTLLIKLLAKHHRYGKIPELLEKYPPSDAIKILEALEQSPEKSRLLVKYLALLGKWRELDIVLNGYKMPERIKFLKELKGSFPRNQRLVLELLSIEDEENLMEFCLSLPLKETLACLDWAPDVVIKQRVVIRLLALNEQDSLLREKLALIGKEELVIEALQQLPEEAKQDELITFYFCIHNNFKGLIDFFGHKASSRAIINLEFQKESLVRNRALAYYLFQDQQYTEAIKTLSAYNPNKDLTNDDLKRLAECFYNLGENKKAIWLLILAWEKDKTEDVLEALIEYRIRENLHGAPFDMDEIKTMPFSGPDILWDLINYFRHFDFTQQAITYANISAEKFQDPRVGLFLGEYYECRQQFDQAVRMYGLAGEKGYAACAMCFFKMKCYDLAVEHFEKLNGKEKSSPKNLYHLGFASYCIQDYSKAIEAYTDLLNLKNDPAVLQDLAILHGIAGKKELEKENFEKASAHFKKGLAVLGDNGNVKKDALIEGLAFSSLQMATRAIITDNADKTDTVLAILNDPHLNDSDNKASLDFLNGLALLKKQRFEEAIRTFAILDKRYPGNAKYMFHKALVAYINRQETYAKNIFEKLAEKAGQNGYSKRSQILLGMIEMQNRNYNGALERFQSVAKDLA